MVQTSWWREALLLSGRKHCSSTTSFLQEARLKRSQKTQEGQTKLQDLSNPLHHFSPPSRLFLLKNEVRRIKRIKKLGKNFNDEHVN